MSSLYSHWFFGRVVFLKPTFFVNFFLSVHSISQVRHTPTSRAALQSQTLVRRRDFPVPTLLGSVGEVEQVHPNAVYEHMTGYHVFNSHWADISVVVDAAKQDGLNRCFESSATNHLLQQRCLNQFCVPVCEAAKMADWKTLMAFINLNLSESQQVCTQHCCPVSNVQVKSGGKL